MSLLATARIDGAPVPEAELMAYYLILIVAGNETTRNAVSGGLLSFLETPSEWERLRRQPELMGHAVEEILRFTSPVIHHARTSQVDLNLRGAQIRPGDTLALFYPSANRDEDVFEDPYRFDLKRTPNEHCGFGGPGPHFCLGANLARREIQVFFRHVFEHLPDLEITGEPERLRSSFIHGIKHMDCSFTPTRIAR